MEPDFTSNSQPLALITVESNIIQDELQETLCVRILNKNLSLSLLLKEDELAPLFSGAAWAGTLLWDASIYLTRHFLELYMQKLQDPDNSLRIIELGAGIGVPGMAASIAGARHVILTEQDDLLDLLRINIKKNTDVLHRENNTIEARALCWGVPETTAYMTEYHNEPIDIILCCDCIYEPLYGKSWESLALTISQLCLSSPHCVVFLSVERRNFDGVDNFFKFVQENTNFEIVLIHQEATPPTSTNSKGQLQLYQLTITSQIKL